LTSHDIPPIVGREALTALATWMRRQNEKDPSRECCGVGDPACRSTISADLPAGKNGPETNKTKINTEGGRA